MRSMQSSAFPCWMRTTCVTAPPLTSTRTRALCCCATEEEGDEPAHRLRRRAVGNLSHRLRPNGALYGGSFFRPTGFKWTSPRIKSMIWGCLAAASSTRCLHTAAALPWIYAGLSPLMSFDPEQPFHPAPNGNPSFANFSGSDEHWRPQAMLEGPDGLIYVGGTAGYGQLEGPLVVWDERARRPRLTAT